MKICSKCVLEKPFSEFNATYCSCKACCKKYYIENKEKYRDYYQQNKEKIKDIRKKYRFENKEKIKEKNKNYYEKNKERLSERKKIEEYKLKRRTYENRKKQTNIQFRLKTTFRKRFRKFLKKENLTGKLAEAIGCSWAELIFYLESKFQPEMNWANHGTTWHIDHYYPLHAFDLTNSIEVKLVWNYKNLKPIWAKDNLSKGAKIPPGFDLSRLAKEWLGIDYIKS